MTESEALRYFLKLICGACMLWLAAGWITVALLHARLRRRRAACHLAGEEKRGG